jgi:general secretion pathway protein B
MSYILDALRKADAERERGTVPGIHAQPTFAGGPQSPSPRGTQPWVFVLGGVAVLLLVIVAVLVWRGGGSDAKPTVAALPAPSAAPLPAAPVAPAPSAAATPVVVATAPTTPAPAVTQRPAAPPRAEPAPVVRKPKPTPVAPAAMPAQASAPVSTNAAAPVPSVPAPAESAESKIYTINELPDDIRRQLPSLTIGGSVYSPVAANRILFINGQVIHEGDVVAPGVVLQQIRMKLAVLTIKGYRYSVPF